MKRGYIISKINKISEVFDKFMIQKIKEEQLPILQNHATLFDILPEDGSEMPFNELATIWNISKSSLSDILNKYESLGLIEKCTSSEDKRSVYISLTQKAIPIKRRLKELEKEFLEVSSKNFSEEEREVLEHDLDNAINNIIKIL